MLPDWPRALGPVTTTARLRVSPSDFFVAEDLGFSPGGEGDHDFLWIEKTGLTTNAVASLLARFANVPPRDIGYSGMKDRYAVTRQWFSVPRASVAPADWSTMTADGLRVLETARHRRKLKRGSHKRNQFRLVLRDLDGSPNDVIERLKVLAESGMPNYFGEQRFGRGAGNLNLATRLFAGRRLARMQRSMALSAARSLIFNNVLAARVANGSWKTLGAGDVAGLDGTGSVFAVEAADEDLYARAAAQDLHPTGPLWGAGTAATAGTVTDMERDIAEASGFCLGLEKHTKTQRRPLRCRIESLDWQQSADSLTLEFSLGRGSFATALIRELVAYD